MRGLKVGEILRSDGNHLYHYKVVSVKRGGWITVIPIEKATGKELQTRHTGRSNQFERVEEDA